MQSSLVARGSNFLRISRTSRTFQKVVPRVYCLLIPFRCSLFVEIKNDLDYLVSYLTRNRRE